MCMYFPMPMRKHVARPAPSQNQIVSQMGTCVYGPSLKMSSSLACCVVCCMTTCRREIHKYIMPPQAKLYPSPVDNFISYQKMGILMSDFSSWVRVQFLATFFLQLITVVELGYRFQDGRMAFQHPNWSISITSQMLTNKIVGNLCLRPSKMYIRVCACQFVK